MSLCVVLDSGLLEMVSNPRASVSNLQCRQWLAMLLARGILVYVPEIADDEIRRELLCASKTAGLRRLDRINAQLRYLPITTPNHAPGSAVVGANAAARVADSGGCSPGW
ncbi:MAG: hypothetical protein MI924_38635 [Chloroflexales bacterium]|nr:hypothetical protein [Chloroflexales bacterium]